MMGGRVHHDIRLAYIIATELPAARTRRSSRPVRQKLRWGSENRKTQKLSVGGVAAEIVNYRFGRKVFA